MIDWIWLATKSLVGRFHLPRRLIFCRSFADPSTQEMIDWELIALSSRTDKLSTRPTRPRDVVKNRKPTVNWNILHQQRAVNRKDTVPPMELLMSFLLALLNLPGNAQLKHPGFCLLERRDHPRSKAHHETGYCLLVSWLAGEGTCLGRIHPGELGKIRRKPQPIECYYLRYFDWIDWKPRLRLGLTLRSTR